MVRADLKSIADGLGVTLPYAKASGWAKKLDMSSSWLLTTSPARKMETTDVM